jgi:hypothetical protein
MWQAVTYRKYQGHQSFNLPSPTTSNSVEQLTAFQAVSPAPPAEQQLGSFIERHRVSINAILRVSPQLVNGSFSHCVRHAHAIDLDNKKALFRGVVRKRSPDAHAGSILNYRATRWSV